MVELLDAGHLFVVKPVGRFILAQFVEHLGVELIIVDVSRVVDVLTFRNRHADVATRARGVCQRMRIVCSGYERRIARTVFLRGTIDGASVHLRLRQRLFQLCMLAGTDGFQLVQVDQQVVAQRHLLVELVREVQVV